MNCRLLLGMASRLLWTARPYQWMITPLIPRLQCHMIMLPQLPDMSILQISTFRKKPAKLKKHKRKQRRKKIRRMNKANKERRNY